MMAETPERLSDLDDDDKLDVQNHAAGAEAKSTGKACVAAGLAFSTHYLPSLLEGV